MHLYYIRKRKTKILFLTYETRLQIKYSKNVSMGII